MLAAVVDAVAELLADPPGEVVACGLDHQGESVLAWDAESGEPLTPIVVWQDKRSQEVLDRLADREEEVRAAQRPSVRSLLLGRQARLAARARRGGRARSGARHAADGHRRLVPLRPPRRRLRHRSLDGVADPAPANRRPGQLRSRPVRDLRGPDRRAAGDPRHGGRPRRPRATRAGRPRCRCAGRPSISRRRSRARGLWSPAGSRRPTGPGVFVLAHVGEEVPEPAGGLLPTVAWAIDGRIEYALDGGVFAAGAMLEWLCRELGVAADPPALGELAREADDSGGVRVLPGAGGPRERRGGGRTPARSSPGSAAAPRARRSRARRSRASPGASRTSSRRSGSRSRSTACGSTAGSRTSR